MTHLKIFIVEKGVNIHNPNEPRLANAVKNIFRKSYEYTEGYKSRGE